MEKLKIFIIFSFIAFNNQCSQAFCQDVVNKTLLTVDQETYTTLDAEFLTKAWEVSKSPNCPTHWASSKSSFSHFDWRHITFPPWDKNKDDMGNLHNLNTELENLLFIALVYAESKRLNLFTPRPEDIKPLQNALVKCTQNPLWNHADTMIYMDKTVRAKVYLQTRGGLSANPTLINMPWYWHE